MAASFGLGPAFLEDLQRFLQISKRETVQHHANVARKKKKKKDTFSARCLKCVLSRDDSLRPPSSFIFFSFFLTENKWDIKLVFPSLPPPLPPSLTSFIFVISHEQDVRFTRIDKWLTKAQHGSCSLAEEKVERILKLRAL